MPESRAGLPELERRLLKAAREYEDELHGTVDMAGAAARLLTAAHDYGSVYRNTVFSGGAPLDASTPIGPERTP